MYLVTTNYPPQQDHNWFDVEIITQIIFLCAFHVFGFCVILGACSPLQGPFLARNLSFSSTQAFNLRSVNYSINNKLVCSFSHGSVCFGDGLCCSSTSPSDFLRFCIRMVKFTYFLQIKKMSISTSNKMPGLKKHILLLSTQNIITFKPPQ